MSSVGRSWERHLVEDLLTLYICLKNEVGDGHCCSTKVVDALGFAAAHVTEVKQSQPGMATKYVGTRHAFHAEKSF